MAQIHKKLNKKIKVTKRVGKQMGSLEKFRRMATVIQDSNDAITFQDLEGNILAWNRGAEIMYGYSEAEALRMNIVDTVPQEYQEEARGFLASLKSGKLVPNLETKRKTKDGRIVDVSLTNTKLTDDKGKLTGIATTERDITEQTKTLEKFRRMATVIQDSNDAITFQDLDGNILAWNLGAEQIYGYSQAEALRMNIVDTVPQEYQAEAREFLSSLKRGELVPTLETKRKTKDGRIVDVWLTNTKLTDDKGKLTGIATTERDISERKGSLEKFRRMATVIQDSNDAITFQDLDGNILAWNLGAEQIYGYSQAEALRMNIVDTVPQEYQAEAREFLSSLKRGELVPTLETKRKTKDGRIVDVWLTNTKLTDDKGKLTGIATTERDISEQKGSLEKFRRMATVIQDSNDAITFQDLEGNILAWNRGAEIMYGYSEAEALSKNIVDTVPKEYQEEAREFLSSLKRGELVPTLETKRKTKDGKIVDVWLANTKLTDDKGKLTGVATTERDITERKQSEASLRDKFRELDYLREGQIALSERMRGEQIISRLGQSILSHLVPFTNAQVGAFYLVTDDKKLQRVSGYALSKNTVSERVIEFGEGLIGQVAEEKQPLLVSEVPPTYFNKIESALGEMVPKSLLICPILYENEVTGVIELASMHPFTEHQRVFLSHVSENIGIAINTSDVRKKVQKQNEALNKAQVLLEEKANEVQRASQYKTEFLANMSHELRTPLNSTLILAKLLMDNASENLTEEQIQFATSIYSSGNDLLNLINDILDLSKVEAGKLTIRVENVAILKVIEGLKQTFQSLAQEKKLIFEVSHETGMPQSFRTDRQRLDQILKNLISNALKFTEKGSVKIRLYRPSQATIAFEVSDSGIGIPKEQQAIIFEAFRQADGTTNRKYGGTGLGLSISRDLAKLLGGSIEVESAAGKGSRFTLILPEALKESLTIVDSPVEAPSRKEAISYKHFEKTIPPAPLPFEDDRDDLGVAGRTVLVIEDDVKFAKILLDIAHELKFKCIVAQGADEGFDLVLEYKPNAIILDIRLPDHLGLTVLDRLKENPKTRHIPVQVMSVLDYKKPSLQMGAIGFMLKPVSHEDIKNAYGKLEANFAKKMDHGLSVKDDEIKRIRDQVFKGRKILLVDDDIRNIFALTAALEQKGAAIFVGRNGQEALDKLNLDPKIDLVLMDIMMPEMDGYEATRRIRKQKRFAGLPIIAVTAKAMQDDLKKCLEAGTNDYVSKPVDLDKLLSLIRVWIPQLEKPI